MQAYAVHRSCIIALFCKLLKGRFYDPVFTALLPFPLLHTYASIRLQPCQTLRPIQILFSHIYGYDLIDDRSRSNRALNDLSTLWSRPLKYRYSYACEY